MFSGSIHTHIESHKDTANVLSSALKEYKAMGEGKPVKIAVTEHGYLSSYEDLLSEIDHHPEDYEGLEIIPGCEVYYATGRMDNTEEDSDVVKKIETAHLILIAKNLNGYKQLCNIISESNINYNEDAHKPIVTEEILRKYVKKGDIICTSACVNGPIGQEVGLKYMRAEERFVTVDKKLKDVGFFEKKAIIDEFEQKKAYIKELKPVMKRDFDENPRVKEIKALIKEDIKNKYLKAELDEIKAGLVAKKEEAERIKKSPEFTELAERAKEAETFIKGNRLNATYTNWIKKKAIWDTIHEEAASKVSAQRAVDYTKTFLDIFGKDDFYFELQNHGLAVEDKVYNNIVKLAYAVGHPHFVASNDIHIAKKYENTDSYRSEVTKREIIKSTRFGYQPVTPDASQYGIKTDEDLRAGLLKIIKPYKNHTAEEIVDNAIKGIGHILDGCIIEKQKKEQLEEQKKTGIKPNHYPVFCEEANKEFERQVMEGINKKFGGKLPNEEYEQRLKKEIEIIESMGYASYHLIVNDYLTYGRLLGYLPPEDVPNAPLSVEELDKYIDEKGYSRIGYSIGPGRGSAAGSLCCYLMGITDIDPIKYNLFFERFLNPERVSMPDIDSDFKTDIRAKVIEYCKKKYGEENVCNIMTKSYGSIKSNLRTIAKYFYQRALSKNPELTHEEEQEIKSYWYNMSDKLAKNYVKTQEVFDNIEGEINDDEEAEVKEELQITKEQAELLTPDETKMITYANKLNGVFKDYGQHAAGVIISKDRLADIIPLMYNETKKNFSTQCTMAQAEAKGLLKMDFLGLKNLDIITNVIKTPTDPKDVDTKIQDYSKRDEILNDERIFKEIYCKGLTDGVFQFESPGMKQVLKEIQPQSIEDLIAAISLYRPGPRDYIPEFVENKRNPDKIHYLCPELKKILEPTYGTIVYQEQVMQIFQDLAGYTLGGADEVRRAMSKKKLEYLVREKDKFIAGCVEKVHISAEDAKALFERMESFASYAFNKSHATAYSVISVFTAYLKLYHTVDFYKETLNLLNNAKRASNIPAYMSEMSKFGLTLLPPSLMYSGNDFTVSEDKTKIYYGLQQIKGESEVDIDKLYRTECLEEFCIKNPDISVKTLEIYAKLGCFKTMWIGEDRGASTTDYLKFIKKVQPLLSQGTEDAEKKIAKYKANFLKAPKYRMSEKDILKAYATEKELLYAPLSARNCISRLENETVNSEVLSTNYNKMIEIPAVVIGVSEYRYTKTKHTPYVMVSLMDKDGVVFERRFRTKPEFLVGRFKCHTDDCKYFMCEYGDKIGGIDNAYEVYEGADDKQEEFDFTNIDDDEKMVMEIINNEDMYKEENQIDWEPFYPI